MRYYEGVRAFITGHTGFKGSWLSAWLKQDGADVAGISFAPEPGRPSLFDEARIAAGMQSHIGDIRDFDLVRKVMNDTRPQIVFHLAAQPLVRQSYRDPIETFGSNVMGTVHVLEAARSCPSVQAVVCVTTDKVYENREWEWGYREIDPLGGKDPYSASKAAAELVAASYRQTLLPMAGDIRMATVRGGNVIGGGDWSEDRLVPDLVRSLESDKPITLRNPGSIRPWQHVLELVDAYLHLGRHLLDGDVAAGGAWNFGPDRGNEVTVERLVSDMLMAWGGEAVPVLVEPSPLREANFLRLDIAKAAQNLAWSPILDFVQTIRLTADWYSRRHRGEAPAALLAEQLAWYRTRRGR
ncbi:MAG: CDP-glucose 4,6-dehydratase [Rhizobiaceae bacterium]